MKRKIITTILLSLVLVSGKCLLAQGPPDPPGGGHGNEGDIPPGGGAPLGDGSTILFLFGAAYGIGKIYSFHHQKQLIEE